MLVVMTVRRPAQENSPWLFKTDLEVFGEVQGQYFAWMSWFRLVQTGEVKTG